MFFDFNKPKYLAILKRQGIEFINLKGEKQEFLFPSKSVRYEEITDKLNLEKELTQFLSKFGSQKAILLLSEEVVFSKVVENDEQAKQFIDSLPLEPAKVLSKLRKDKDGTKIYATDKVFVTTIKEILTKAKWQVKYTFPQSAVEAGDLKKINSKINTLKTYEIFS